MTTRREFLKKAAIATAGLAAGPRLFARGASAAASDKVVVLLNFYGGNDGLNTVIPLGQYDRYRRLRSQIGFARESILGLSGEPDFGLNPGMSALRDLYNSGRVAVINGLGTPQETSGLFDHSAGQFVFQTCDTVRAATAAPPTGWLGRYLDTVESGVVSTGIDMGGGRLALTGSSTTPLTISSIDQFQLELSFDADSRLAAYRRIMGIPNGESTVAETNRLTRVEALEQSGIIVDRTSDYAPAATYPEDSWLGYQLYQTAALINADLGIRAVAVYSGGYDTHSGQDSDYGGGLGYHDVLLKDVSDSVAAFYADIEAHGHSDRVVVMTLSEFGRRAYENNDHGTDHGFSSVGFVVGKPVKGGVYGTYPSLDEDDLVLDGNTDMTTDFRSVYSTLAARFLGVDPVPLVGGTFPQLGFL